MTVGAFEALREAISSATLPSDWVVLDYGRDFERVWAEDFAPEGNLAVLWDSLPEDAQRDQTVIAEHLTPYDWVLSLSAHLLRHSPSTRIRIAIVDAYSWKLPEAPACRMADGLLATLPWVSITRLLPRERQSTVPHSQLPERFVDLIKSAEAPQPLDSFPGAAATLDVLSSDWREKVATGENYHDVNNVIGPLLLLSDLTSANLGTARRAFAQALARLGLRLNRTDAVDLTAAPAAGIACSLADELGREVRFVLVDDRTNAGWGQTVARLLDLPGEIAAAPPDRFERLAGDSRVSLYASSTPEPLLRSLEALEGQVLAAGEPADWRFRLRLTAEPCAHPSPIKSSPLEILLLDLRLCASGSDEERLAGRIGEVAQRLQEARIAPALTSKPEPMNDASEALSLTALARLVTSADPALPIILFSSTGQRAVTEAVRAHPTIITTFEKPRFDPRARQSGCVEVHRQWRVSVEQAIAILRARAACEALPRSPESKVAECTSPGKVVELFTDEVGDMFAGEAVEIFGWVLIHSSPEAAERFHGSSYFSQFIRDFPSRNADLEAWKNNLRQRGKIVEAAIRNAARISGTEMRMLRLRGSYDDSGSPWELGDDSGGRDTDTLYRGMISSMIDAAFFHLIPREIGTMDFTARLYLASLVEPGGDDPGSLARAAEARKWGIRRGRVLHYFSGNLPQAIVQGLCQIYMGSKPRFEIAGAFSNNQSPDESMTRPFHYLVDAMIGRRNRHRALNLAPVIFSGLYAEPLRQLQQAVRQAAVGRIGAAIALANRNDQAPSTADPSDIHRQLLGVLASFADRMTPRDFSDLIEHLSKRDSARENPQPFETLRMPMNSSAEASVAPITV